MELPNAPDLLIPLIGFAISVRPFFTEKKLKWYHYGEIFGGLIIMGLSIYSSWSNSSDTSQMKSNIESLVENRKIDSINNSNFQNFLKDSLGVERDGNKVRVVNRNTYIKYVTVNKTESQNTNAYSSNLPSIQMAASEMKQGKFRGRDRLRKYFLQSTNPTDSLTAKNLYDQIYSDIFNDLKITMSDNETSYVKKFDSSSIQILRSGKMPENDKLRNEIASIMKYVNGKDDPDAIGETPLITCAAHILLLRRLTGIDFNLLDIEGVNRWYNHLKK